MSQPKPDYIRAAKDNLQPPANITPQQYTQRIAAAQAQATIALAEQQARTADAAETANLIAYLNVATQYRLAYAPSEAVLKAVQANVETRLGLA